MLVTDLANIGYLTGFTGSNAAVVLTADTAVLITDGRYQHAAAEQCPGLPVVDDRDAAGGALAWAGQRTGAEVAFEAEHVSFAEYQRWRQRFTELRLVPTIGLVEQQRRRKDAAELGVLTRACTITTEAIGALAADVRPGVTERWLARRFAERVLDLGGDGLAFDPIIAAGPNSAIPHHRPTDRPLAAGDLLTIDAGAKLDGYHADCTRCFVVGAPPTTEQRELFDAVATAAAQARAALAIDVGSRELDAAARAALGRFEPHFRHGLGHGVGLAIHEAPMLGAQSTATIAHGDVLTIEPGAYLPGFGGVRIEDTLAVAESGITCLTGAARDLIRLG